MSYFTVIAVHQYKYIQFIILWQVLQCPDISVFVCFLPSNLSSASCQVNISKTFFSLLTHYGWPFNSQINLYSEQISFDWHLFSNYPNVYYRNHTELKAVLNTFGICMANISPSIPKLPSSILYLVLPSNISLLNYLQRTYQK